MTFLGPENLRRLGRVWALLCAVGVVSCSQVGRVPEGGGGGIAVARAVEEGALGGKKGEEFDSQGAGFVVEPTPGSVEDVRWQDEEVGFWQMPGEGRFPIFATVGDAVWGEDEEPVYRSISEFRRPDGFTLPEEAVTFAGKWKVPEEKGSPGESEEGEKESGEVGEGEITADREVGEAVVTAVSPAGEVGEGSAKDYEVKEGDTLWEIGRAHGMTVPEIKRINGLRSDRIYPGDRLRLPAE